MHLMCIGLKMTCKKVHSKLDLTKLAKAKHSNSCWIFLVK